MRNMPNYSVQEIQSNLSVLYKTASHLGGWNKKHADEFIRVGEYAFALDSVAYAYLENNIPMTPDQFEIFDKLATAMELEKDPEYDGVARLRAQAKEAPF